MAKEKKGRRKNNNQDQSIPPLEIAPSDPDIKSDQHEIKQEDTVQGKTRKRAAKAASQKKAPPKKKGSSTKNNLLSHEEIDQIIKKAQEKEQVLLNFKVSIFIPSSPLFHRKKADQRKKSYEDALREVNNAKNLKKSFLELKNRQKKLEESLANED